MSELADYVPIPARRASAPIGLLIRRVRGADAGEIARMRSAREGRPFSESADWAGKVITSTGRDEAVLFVAEVGSVVVGYGYAKWVDIDGLPAGFYLLGLLVADRFRRRGIGRRLTDARLHWIRDRADTAYYFANEVNDATIDLHAGFGFRLLRRGVRVPGAAFSGGVGVLYKLDLRQLLLGEGARSDVPSGVNSLD